MSALSAAHRAARSAYETPRQSTKRSYFFVTGETCSELLPRVLNPFAKLGFAPYRVHASSEQGLGDEMSIELRFENLEEDQAAILAARCRTTVGVRSVLLVTNDA